MQRTIFELESSFAKICEEAYPYEWDEDHISFSLMQELRKTFSYKRLEFNGWSKIVRWQSFKNRGKQEYNYGDIALIVNVQFSSGEILSGVVNIEAKRYFDSGYFESVDLDQLDRIHENLPYSHLLLYYYRKQKHNIKFPDGSAWQSNLWISPINTAKQLLKQTTKRENWKILRPSFPFSQFLTSRAFWGLDLDFREKIRKDIEQGIDRISPKYLAIVDVFYDGQTPSEGALSQIWEPM